MMMRKIISALKASGASDWKIVERRKESLEWYFIGRDLDTARSVETTLHDLTVYVDGESEGARTRGECTLKVQPGASDADIATAIARAAATAATMKNPWFPLPEPSAEKPVALASGFEGAPLGEGMERVRSAMYSSDGEDGARINSLEIFLARVSIRVLNSRGVDVSWSRYQGHSEFIVNAGKGREEIELFEELDFSDPDAERLSRIVRERLAAARDRLAAKPTPDCAGLPLLLSGEQAGQILEYYFNNVDAAAVYEKYGNFALGDDVGTEGGRGDVIELAAVPMLAGSPKGGPCDLDGLPLARIRCIEGGKVARLVATTKFAHYLGLPATGAIALFEIAPGSRSERELRAMPHLEGVTFSDFFVDSTTGDFGGEIRLAYLCRDGARLPVTGGSVTGSVGDNRGEMLLSRELETNSRGRTPTVCLLPKVTVSPAE